MITVCRAAERNHDRHGKHDAWFTFPSKSTLGWLTGGFGDLELFAEDRLPPSAVARTYAPHDNEIITYVREGALAFEDSLGRCGVLQAGEFQRMTAGHRVHHKARNPSRTHSTHGFRIWLHPSQAELDPDQQQKRFTVADRRAVLRVVASSDGRRGSLRIHQDVSVYSSFVEQGHHIVYPLLEGRVAWLHLVHGEASVGAFVLSSGDGAGHVAERVVTLTAREPTEILMVDAAWVSRT